MERDFLRISHQAWDEEQSGAGDRFNYAGTVAIIVGLLSGLLLIVYLFIGQGRPNGMPTNTPPS